MIEKRYIITECCYHTGYLIDKLKDQLGGKDKRYGLIIRNTRKLSMDVLNRVHHKLRNKSNLSEAEFSELNKAYGGLSKSELALINMYGVAPMHALSLSADHCADDLNSTEIKTFLEKEAETKELSAGIFLDCILDSWWIKLFQNRIVNAHSAILPYARGMYAIEQTAASGQGGSLGKVAGASLHYIDEGIDTGPLIVTRPLKNVWDYKSIWEVKAACYMEAFDLLSGYMSAPHSFRRDDSYVPFDEKGPLYRAKDFTPYIQYAAETAYKKMRLRVS